MNLQLSLFHQEPEYSDLPSLYAYIKRVQNITEGFVGVTGTGKNKIACIGEAPGYIESLTGQAFRGPAGKKMREMFTAIEIVFDDCSILNVVKARPTQLVDGKIKDRTPTWSEIEKNIEFLTEELRYIDKDRGINIIVPLGGTALKAILKDKNAKIGQYLGKPLNLEGWPFNRPIIAYPLLHPAALLHNPSLENRKAQWEALQGLDKILKGMNG